MLDRLSLPGPHSGEISPVESIGGEVEDRLEARKSFQERNHNAGKRHQDTLTRSWLIESSKPFASVYFILFVRGHPRRIHADVALHRGVAAASSHPNSQLLQPPALSECRMALLLI